MVFPDEDAVKPPPPTPRIIESRLSIKPNDTPTLRNWRYAVMMVQPSPTAEPFWIVPDTGANGSLIDAKMLAMQFPTVEVKSLNEPTKCKGISGSSFSCTTYANIILYAPAKLPNGDKVLVSMAVTVLITPDLRPGLLLGMDYLGLQGAIVNLRDQKIIFPLMEDAETNIIIRRRQAPRPPYKAKAAKSTIIPPKTIKRVPFHTNEAMPKDYDCEFEAERLPVFDGLPYNSIVNQNTKDILIRNDTSKPIKVPRNAKLGYICRALHSRQDLRN